MIFLVGIYNFTWKSKHLLIMLMSLEFMVLGLYFGLAVNMDVQIFNLIFLVFTVCTGAVGLGLLVAMGRVCGTSNMSVFNLS
uniref:NADH-ubiquinone oxidoreductase chain 4L n=1 Tax=Lipothrix lubbocki TaxID=1387126 RepID=A0A6H0EXI1_9HEXA|nr:NADH dehydrogenase subunit 4L [Lipothrix lubbocki]